MTEATSQPVAGPTDAITTTPLPAWVRDALRCPVCRGELGDTVNASGDPQLTCTGECASAGGRSYRIDEGIPVLLADESVTGNGAATDPHAAD